MNRSGCTPSREGTGSTVSMEQSLTAEYPALQPTVPIYTAAASWDCGADGMGQTPARGQNRRTDGAGHGACRGPSADTDRLRNREPTCSGETWSEPRNVRGNHDLEARDAAEAGRRTAGGGGFPHCVSGKVYRSICWIKLCTDSAVNLRHFPKVAP